VLGRVQEDLLGLLPVKEAALNRLLREVTGLKEKPDVWWACGYVTKARRLSAREQQLVLIALGNTLVRHRTLLDLADALLFEAQRGERKYDVLLAQSRLAEARGASPEAKRLAAAALEAPDAPTESENLISEWAAREVEARKADSSVEGRRSRLDVVLAAAARARRTPTVRK